MNATESQDSLVHTLNLKRKMKDLIDHLRLDIEKVEDPAVRVLFEVSSEVLKGLHKAVEEFEAKNEPAWRVD